MLNTYRQKLESITRSFTEKELKKMKVNSLCNLSTKLVEFEDQELEMMMVKIKEMIGDSIHDENFDMKCYKKKVIEVQQIVQSKFDLQERGSVSGQYVGIGIAIGTGVGVAFTSINAGMMSTFSALGIVFGLSLGKQKESALDKEGKIY